MHRHALTRPNYISMRSHSSVNSTQNRIDMQLLTQPQHTPRRRTTGYELVLEVSAEFGV